jgi:hypothetical protein
LLEIGKGRVCEVSFPIRLKGRRLDEDH